MEQGKNRLFEWLTNQIAPDGNVRVVYEPDNNVFLSSKLTDNNGNVNLFKMIVDRDAPDIRQRIYE